MILRGQLGHLTLRILTSLWLAGVLCLLTACERSHQQADPLTPSERQWIDEHAGPFTIATDPFWPPLAAPGKQGQMQGAAVDMATLLAKKLGLSFEQVQTQSWNDTLNRLKNGQLDVISAINYTPQRGEYLLFTEPYLSLPSALIVRKGQAPIESLGSLGDLQIGVTHGAALGAFVQEHYPQLNLTLINDDKTGLVKVSFGELDGFLADMGVASYYIQEQSLTNLAIGLQVPYRQEIRMATRNDEPVLHSILCKGMAMVQPAELQAIQDRWIRLEHISIFRNKNVLALIILLVLASSGLAAAAVMWNRTLRRKVDQQTAALRAELTARQRIQEIINRKETIMRAMFESTSDGILIIDENGHVLYANARFLQMWRLTSPLDENVREMELLDRLRPQLKDPEGFLLKIGTIYQTDKALLDTVETKDGRMIERYSYPLAGEHQIGGRVWSYRDITARLRAEESVRESEDRFQFFMDNLPASVVLKDSGGHVVFVNRHAEKELGAKDWLGKTASDYREGERGRHIRLLDQEIIQSGPQTVEDVFTTEKGEPLILEIHKFPIERPGKPRMLGMIALNVTQEKKTLREKEELEEKLLQAMKMEAIGQLAGGVAHDFNNLLQAIQGYTDMSRYDLPDDHPIQHNLSEVLRATERASTLVRQLLTFSRREAAQTKVLDLNDLIANMLKMIGRVIGEQVELSFRPGPSVKNIKADPGQMEQVLMNLCVNARDAMPTGGKITIETQQMHLDESYCQSHPWAEPGEYCVAVVKDTGQGMAPDVRDRIFEPFFTTKEVGKGTGLGLATVYGIVKRHKGLIHVYSEPDHGTTFRVYLPSVDISVEEAAAKDPWVYAVPNGSETILLAEDEELVRNIAVQVLRRHGYKVLVATNGREAIELFKANAQQIDLAFLDVIMPKVCGGEVYEAIRQLNPHTPVLFCSGYSFNALEMVKAEQGDMKVLHKPYSPNDLLTRVREVLDTARPAAAASQAQAPE